MKKAGKIRAVVMLIFIAGLLNFHLYAEARDGKSPVQRDFNVQAAKLRSMLPNFMKLVGFNVESKAMGDCFQTSYVYVPVDRFVTEEYVTEMRHPNFDIIRFLKATTYYHTGIPLYCPPYCTIWQRAAYRYEVCFRASNVENSTVSVRADVIGWERCFSWHEFRSNGELEQQFLCELTKFIKEKCQ